MESRITVPVTFDSNVQAWTDVQAYNETFLQLQRDWLNDLLQRRGHLFLNEVYDLLGAERTQQGAIGGWLFDDWVEFFEQKTFEETGAIWFTLSFRPNILSHLKEK